jgi:hypothetical protein
MATSSGQTIKKTRFFQELVIDPQTDDRLNLTQLKANRADGVLVMTTPKVAKPELRVIKVSTDHHTLIPSSTSSTMKPTNKKARKN